MTDATDPKTGYPVFVLGDVKFGITEPFPVTAASEPISLATPKRRRGEGDIRCPSRGRLRDARALRGRGEKGDV